MKKPKTYDAKAIEEKWKKFWEKEKIYKFDLKKGKKVYSIDTPPPTLSGEMHIGHAFSYSQQDFIARFQRMFTGNLFYPFGTDDNGLPTERLVERLKKVKSKDMSRSDFIALCLKALKETTPGFIKQWKDLGLSCDYDIYYSTIDENSRKISQKSFIDMYKKGEIYKKQIPTIWCPECQTSIAQAELEDKERVGLFSTLKFKVGNNDLLIATTRPELLQACVGVFVHPKDKRYKKFVGKKASVPLFGYEVPILEDKSADMEKGTGAMMICSYGDKYDVDAINRHRLAPRVIFDKKARIKQGEYKGLGVKEARKKILEDLKSKGLIREERQITHAVNCHDKCGTEIEFIPTEQWFLKILNKKKIWLAQGKKIKWHPKFMHKRYENWINGLEWDWSISRDRHFGVPIPVWYCEKCRKIILAKNNELPIDPVDKIKKCPKCGSKAKPEEKVLDTWATSSLTPQIASFLIKNKIKIPFSLRPQAHDIIRTWAFYTIVKSYLHEKKIPWQNVMVSGFVKLGGEKMSKSKGNVVDPSDVIREFGADALRYWAAGSRLGEDLDYHEKDLVAGKRFITKLINASRFVFMNLKDYKGKKPKKLENIDDSFLNELNRVVFTTTHRFKDYEYSRAKFNVEEFFWNYFCDNYLEIVKKRVYQGRQKEEPFATSSKRGQSKGEARLSAQYTLYQSLLTIIKLIAPIMPFITEEIYQTYFRKFEKDKSIHLSKWPRFDKERLKKCGEDRAFYELISILGRVRQEKTKAKKAMNAKCIVAIENKDKTKLKDVLDDLKDVSGAHLIKTGKFRVEFC